MSIGNNLRMLREQHGYSQELVAEKVGVSRQAISKWENETSRPSTENLIKIANFYQVELSTVTSEGVVNDDQQKIIANHNKLRVLSYLSRLGIIVSLTGYYGHYLPRGEGPFIHWILLFIVSCVIIFYSNKKYYADEYADKKLIGWDTALTLVVVFIPRILQFSVGWNILIMNVLSIGIMMIIMEFIRRRWPV